ncbi:MAG: hypothetical protein OXL38_21855 [Gammaproteobacteria bacterium]|nr:hypothetical protein [Gammaproteobacteria bacterium]
MPSALVFGPFLGPVLFALLTSYAVSLQIDEALQPIDVPVIAGRGAENLMTHLHRRQIDVGHDRFDDVEALREAVRQGDVNVGLVVAEDFPEALANGGPARLWLVADTANNSARPSISRLRLALDEYGLVIGVHRLALRGIDPTLAQPVAVLTDDVSTPSGGAILLLGMMTYFLLFSTLLGGTQVAIDTTAGERERGSLEPLLTLAVSRAVLVCRFRNNEASSFTRRVYVDHAHVTVVSRHGRGGRTAKATWRRRVDESMANCGGRVQCGCAESRPDRSLLLKIV